VSHNIEQQCNILFRLEPIKNDKNTQNIFAVFTGRLEVVCKYGGVASAFFIEFPSKKTKKGNQANFAWVGFYLLMQK
jgi:hypothetical protein